jgi:hypothetical protein
MSAEAGLISDIVAGGTGISQIVAGLLMEQDVRELKQEHEKNRPVYEVPIAINEQIEILRQRAGTGLPGEELIASQIQEGTAQGVSQAREAATSAADLLGATTQLVGQQTSALTNLQIESARQRAANELNLAQGLGNLAQYQEQEFIYNEAIPYDVRLNELMGIQQSAIDMTMAGIGNLSGSGTSFSTTDFSSLGSTGSTGTTGTTSPTYNYDFSSAGYGT